MGFSVATLLSGARADFVLWSPSLLQIFFSPSFSSPSFSGCQMGMDDTYTNNLSPLKISLLTIGIWREAKAFFWVFCFQWQCLACNHCFHPFIFPSNTAAHLIYALKCFKRAKHVRHLIQWPEVTRTTDRSWLILSWHLKTVATVRLTLHRWLIHACIQGSCWEGRQGAGVWERWAPSDKIRHLALGTIIRIPSSLKPRYPQQDHHYSSTCCGSWHR